MGSGYDLTIHEFDPHVGSLLSAQSQIQILCPPSLCPSTTHARSLALKDKQTNKQTNSEQDNQTKKSGSKILCTGTWVAQSIKRGTLDLISGHDLMQFVGSSPMLGSVLTAQSLLGVLSLPLSVPPLLTLSLSLSLSQNK